MSKKIITPELLENRLTAKGFSEENFNSEDKIKEAVLNHYDIELVDDWEDGLTYYIYAESTQDGYEVFIATGDPRNISINEDVHYYDSDLADALCEGIRYADELSKIFIDDLDANFIMEAMQTLYELIYDNMVETVTQELLNEGYEE
jgi:hypothetical protein